MTDSIKSTLQKNYELREYKKGLKLAEGILKKYPDHGGKYARQRCFDYCNFLMDSW